MTTPPCSNRFAALQRIQTQAYRKAPAIRDIYERANMAPADLCGASDLARLPVTTKDQLLALQRAHPPFGGFLAADTHDIRRIFVSPGPIYEPELSSDVTGRGFAQVFNQAGIGPGDRVLNTWSYHLVPAGLLLDQGIASTGATIIPCGPGGAEQQAQLILELDITCICASTSFFITLIETLERMGYQLPRDWRVKNAMLGGEMGNWMHKRRDLEQRYAINTFSAYATGDFGLIGYEEDGLEGYRIHPERLVQVCDPVSGEPLPVGSTGEIVVTTLESGWPLVRFGTGDVAQALSQTEDGLVDRIGLLQGRVGQGVKVREVFVYPRNIEELLSRVPEINRAQLVVETLGHRETMTLRAELKPKGTPANVEAHLADAFKQVTRLKLDNIEWLEVGQLAEGDPTLVDRKHAQA